MAGREVIKAVRSRTFAQPFCFAAGRFFMSTLQERIANLEAILDAGAKGVQVDGQQVRFDLHRVQQRLAQLQRQAEPETRVRSASVDLSGF